MNDQEFNQIIKKFFSSELSDQERQRLFDEYARREKAHPKWDKQLMGDPEHTSAKLFRKVNRRIAGEARQWPYLLYKIAAAIVLVSGLALLIYFNNQPQTSHVVLNTQDAIKPGEDKAILLTGDGRTIVLNQLADGAVLQEDAAKIRKINAGQIAYEGKEQDRGDELEYNTIQTPKGGQFQVVLSDGTKVWLNAWSSLSFPVKFSSKERIVELKGEAYFEVAKNGAPFYVKTNKQTVRVLGTHFNIQNYADEDASAVTLIEGSVYVRPKGADSNFGRVLSPGQQAYITEEMHIKSVDVQRVLAWKNGFFQFNKTDLKSVMRQLARWYNIEVQYENINPSDRSFSGKIRRDVELTDVLEMLGYFEVEFIVEDRTITVKPNNQIFNE